MSAHPVRRRVVIYGLTLLVAFLVFVAIGRLWVAPSMLYPGCTVELPPPGDPRLPPAVTVVDYGTERKLRGAWVRSGKPGALTVIYFHGNAESAGTGLDLGHELARAGFDVFLAEYRGYGGIPGPPTEEGLHADALAALEVVRTAGVTDERLVVLGCSLGSGVAVELARKGHGCALVLVAPYTSIVDVARGIAGPLAPLVVRDTFESIRRIPEVKVPVTVIHGTADTLIPFALGKRLSEAARRGKLIPIEGRGHNDLPWLEPFVAELSAIRPGLTTK